MLISEANQSESGFTLLELIVVTIIVAILAGVAVPTFLRQKTRAWDAAVQADLRSAAFAQESALSFSGSYLTAVTNGPANLDDLADFGLRLSNPVNYQGNTPNVAALVDGPNTYCITATSASSQVFSFSSLRGLTRSPCPAAAPY